MAEGRRPAETAAMKEPIITATLLSIYLGARGTATAIGAIQRLAT
jgi:hypothetical protein